MGVQNRRIHALERLYIPKAVAIFIIGFCPPNPPRQSMGEGHTTGTYKNILPSISISLSLSLSEIGGLVLVFGLSFSPGGIPWGDPPSLGVIPGDHPRRSPQGTPTKDPRRGSPQGTLPIPPPHFLLCFRSYPPGRSPPRDPPSTYPQGIHQGIPPRGQGIPPGDPPSLFRLPTSSFVSQASHQIH